MMPVSLINEKFFALFVCIYCLPDYDYCATNVISVYKYNLFSDVGYIGECMCVYTCTNVYMCVYVYICMRLYKYSNN